jgi:hypothetical protein
MQMKISKLNLTLNISAVFKLYLILLVYIFLNKFGLRFKSIKPNSVLLYILILIIKAKCLFISDLNSIKGVQDKSS